LCAVVAVITDPIETVPRDGSAPTGDPMRHFA
jgi:hypothetical protein